MPRIRSLHPGIFTDEAYMSLGFPARELVKGLWCQADDQGVFEWKPLTLKARILPADALDVGLLLDELVDKNFIKRFVGEGSKPLGAIRNFQKYQRPKKPTAIYALPEELESYVGYGAQQLDTETELRRHLHRQQRGKCAYCATTISHYAKRQDSLEIGPVVPLSRGGSAGEENLAAACRSCFRTKSDMTGEEFRNHLVLRLASARHESQCEPNASSPLALYSHADASPGVALQRKEEGGRKEEDSSLRSESSDASRSPRAGADERSTAIVGVLRETGLLDHVRWRGDGARIGQWIDAGFDPHRDIVPAMKAALAKMRDPPSSLKYFDGAVTDYHRDRMSFESHTTGGQHGGAHQTESIRDTDIAARVIARIRPRLATAVDRGAGADVVPVLPAGAGGDG